MARRLRSERSVGVAAKAQRRPTGLRRALRLPPLGQEGALGTGDTKLPLFCLPALKGRTEPYHPRQTISSGSGLRSPLPHGRGLHGHFTLPPGSDPSFSNRMAIERIRFFQSPSCRLSLGAWALL